MPCGGAANTNFHVSGLTQSGMVEVKILGLDMNIFNIIWSLEESCLIGNIPHLIFVSPKWDPHSDICKLIYDN